MDAQNAIFMTGEYFQQKANIYIGFSEDFQYNPVISLQTERHFDLGLDHHGIEIGGRNQTEILVDWKWANPRILFCYGHRLPLFIERVLPYLQNPFILISHNSDENICGDWPYAILTHALLETWYAQNACLCHPKLRVLPIGLANSQWAHGNLALMRSMLRGNIIMKKPDSIYFQFKVETNFEKRRECMARLWGRLDWLCETTFEDHLSRLSSHEFCICPEGNGVDTHRFWECMYLRVVPIVLQSPFIANLYRMNTIDFFLPMIVLEKWEDLFVLMDSGSLNYSNYADKFSVLGFEMKI
jgi:hypothetical protein